MLENKRKFFYTKREHTVNSMDTTEHIQKKKGSVSKKIVSIILVLIFLGLVGSTGYFFYQYQQLKKQYQNSSTAVSAQTQQIVDEVKKLMLLPKGEVPTVATITDVSKLRNQQFFVNATNGDKVLIYTNAKEAILYDPKENIIINVAPITLGNQPPSQAQQAKIGIRNASANTALTATITTQLTNTYPGINISLKEVDATLRETTIVVPISSQATQAAQDIAKTLNATIGTLPANEIKPQGVDILIIVGKDKI